jgi:non-homologous end joining protein Ku
LCSDKQKEKNVDAELFFPIASVKEITYGSQYYLLHDEK